MKANEIIWYVPKRRGATAGPVPSEPAIRLTATKNGEAAQSAITVYASLMKELRIQCGDRVDVGHSLTHIYLRRSPSGSLTLSPRGQSREEREAQIGKYVTSIVKWQSPIVGACKVLSRSEIVIEDGVITIPKP